MFARFARSSTATLRPRLAYAPPPISCEPRRLLFNLSPAPQPGADAQQDSPEEPARPDAKPRKSSAAFDSALGTLAGVAVVALAGIAYHNGYKAHVLHKIERAFQAGYDPVLALASAGGAPDEQVGKVRRAEQDFIDNVVNGSITGQYLLLLGPKGCGKTTMILDAAAACDGEGFAMFEAHEDQEVVRLRLGKAIDFEFNEDSFAGLFQRRDPREGGAGLDIERALAKLEKVAIQYRQRKKRPLVLVVNNLHHLFPSGSDGGFGVLLQLQQRAEAWAAAGVVTFIFTSDDFSVYRHLLRNASRMHTLSARDLTPRETFDFLKHSYAKNFPDAEPVTPAEALQVWDRVGGRLSYLNRVAAYADMAAHCERMVQHQSEWLHSRLGLIPAHDDDVMDEQKVASAGFSLFQALAERAKDIATTLADIDQADDDETAAAKRDNLKLAEQDLVHVLPDEWDPKLTYREARVVQTRADFLIDLDHQNIINIDVHHNVRPDSRLMLSCFKAICAEPDFQSDLDTTKDRIDEIESLHRTSELTVKPGDADLGGFLRLRLGRLGPEHEKKVDDDDSAGPGGGADDSESS